MHGDDGRRAIETVRFLISDPGTEGAKLGGTGSPGPLVEYQGVGELVALFRSGYIEQTSASSGIEISARPNFVLRKGRFPDPGYAAEAIDDSSDRIRAMLAVALQEGHYGVAAPGLQWDIRLAFVWTRTRISEDGIFLKLSFQWRFHEHPHPFQLIAWNHDWRKFVQNIQSSPEERLERIAYAWIFYLIKWLDVDLGDARDPLKITNISFHDWNLLLKVQPPTIQPLTMMNREGNLATSQDWRTQTLPLLARPEIGLPPELQTRLLSYVSEEIINYGRSDKLEWLKDQRRRLITDAIIAAGEQDGRRAENAENSKRVECIVGEFENQHCEVYGERSPWWKIIEDNSSQT